MPDQFQKFTERARRVLALAEEEARRFNHCFIGTEHLLLGLLREGDGVAGRVLNKLGIQLPEVRSAVEFIIGRGEPRVIEEIGLTERAKKVIELAVDEAKRLNHHYIGTEHLPLGLVREGEGIAVGVLESQGAPLEKVRIRVLQVLQGVATFDQSTHHKLVRVLPIAQVQRQHDIEVIALSLEVYADSFVVTLLIQAAEGAPFTYDSHGLPGLALEAVDDQGRRYTGRSLCVSRGSNPHHWQWRLAWSFTRALGPGALQVQVEIAELRWYHPDPDRPRLAATQTVPGPWIFPVLLAGETSG